MEKLQIQKRGEIQQSFVDIDYSLDEKYKPGLFLQAKYFLEIITEDFCPMEEQYEKYDLYKRIANY